MSNSCLFCGAKGAGVLTNEHVIPQWLVRHLGLPADDQLFQGVASTATQTLVKPARVHSSFNFVQGHVCQDCNDGWMSRLEVAAQPILIPLIDRQRPIASLTTEEKLTVSKWVAKTAYMVSWAAPLEKRVQQDHLMALNGDGGKPFSGVAIFGMQSDFKENFSYLHRLICKSVQLSQLAKLAMSYPLSVRNDDRSLASPQFQSNVVIQPPLQPILEYADTKLTSPHIRSDVT